MAKGRQPSAVEFLNLVGELLDLKPAALARRIGKQVTNVSDYLAGNKVPGKKVLISALRHAFEWEVTAVYELVPVAQATTLPKTPGIYCFYDSSGSVTYVGQASDLRQEVSLRLQAKMNFAVRRGPTISKKTRRKHKDVAEYISAYEVRSPRMRHNLEALLLRAHPNQSHNDKMGNFK